MQPLKTYEVTLRQTRIFTAKVQVSAENPEDARTLAKYQSVWYWREDEEAENVYPLEAKEKIDLEKAREHYEAQVKLADATSLAWKRRRDGRDQ